MARVVVDVMLKPEILDPQGQAVANALPRLGVGEVRSVRIGKRIEIDFDGEPDLERAREIADRLLANPVIEDFHLRVEATGAESAPVGEADAGDAETVTADATPDADEAEAEESDADEPDADADGVEDAAAGTTRADRPGKGGN